MWYLTKARAAKPHRTGREPTPPNSTASTLKRNLQSPDAHLPECQETAPAGQFGRKMLLKATKKPQKRNDPGKQ